MFRRLIVGLVGAASVAVVVPMAAPADAALLRPVPRVDLERYLGGVWHQLAANPAPYNVDCVRDTTAKYSLIDRRTVGRVITSSRISPTTIRGRWSVTRAGYRASC